MKKTTFFAGSIGMLALAATASANPYLGMSLESVDNQGLIEGSTYHLYVNIEAGARIDAVFGNSSNTLNIGVENGGFVQSGYGGATSMDINEAFFPFFPELEWDSFVTIGLLSNSSNALNNVGIDWTDFENGGDLITDNGSWFVTPNDAQGQEVNGRVLIGQFTITEGGSLVGSLSVQGKDADGVTFQATNISWVPAPGALALLGVAGLAGRRRRR
jgi:hypothetical protein